MKKLLTIVMVVAAILAAPVAQAQLRLGVKLGANISNFELENSKLDFKNTQLANFTGGVMAEWIIAYGFGFDVGLNYTAKGTQYNFGENLGLSSLFNSDDKLKNVVHYLEVPVNLKYKLRIPVVEDIVIPFVYVGPSFAFKVGEAVTFGDKILEPGGIKINNQAVDCALNVGLGVELIKHLNVAVQYGWGLGKAADIEIGNVDITGDDAFKSGAWTITVAWLF